ncbi:hypothetical protein SAMN04489796_1011288 [Winogradskyella thalassocola]|uniref:Uncharacterized protein n=1 Tax=Winogradskyella thalassocola TaxID=262004 RepID=A0A1G7ZBK7_9FLAO|nr:hypothetical protein SAMN04489796_1011288 [Winogradskyella thalassocola]
MYSFTKKVNLFLKVLFSHLTNIYERIPMRIEEYNRNLVQELKTRTKRVKIVVS